MPITSVPNCKAFRGITSDNQEHDGELQRLIAAVQEFLERECERKFDKATVTEYYNGAGFGSCSGSYGASSFNRHAAAEWIDTLVLARPPISSIANIWDDPLRIYATPLASGFYVIEDAASGLVRLDRMTFQKGFQNIKVTYDGGFTTMPPDLEQAAIEMVWAAREKGLNNLVGVRSRSVADGNVQYVNLAWGSLAEDIVNKYRLHTGVA